MNLIHSKSHSLRFTISIFTTLTHFIFIFLIFFDVIYLLIILIEIIFYITNNFNPIKLLRIIVITLIVFFLNVLFYEGKVIFEFLSIKITYEGLIESIKRSSVILTLFIFTSNILNKNKNIFLFQFYNKPQNNLVMRSIHYFFLFLDYLNTNKLSLKRLLFFIQRVKKDKITNYKNETKITDYEFLNVIMYNVCSIITVLISSVIIAIKSFKHI